jgi:hypothetical protein
MAIHTSKQACAREDDSTGLLLSCCKASAADRVTPSLGAVSAHSKLLLLSAWAPACEELLKGTLLLETTGK